MRAVFIYCEDKEKKEEYVNYAWQQVYTPISSINDINAVLICEELWICGDSEALSEDVQAYINKAEEYEIPIQYVDDI